MTIDKTKIDELIPKAYDALRESKVLNPNGKLDSGYRGQISAFGAAVSTGSVLSAVSFFSKKASGSDHDEQRKSNDYDRSKLMDAIAWTIDDCPGSLYDYVQKDIAAAKEQVLHAAIALKLAMSLYDWGD